MDTMRHMYTYTQTCMCPSTVYIHIWAWSVPWIWLNLIFNSVQLLYIQYEMSCFMDVKGVKKKKKTNKLFRSFKPEHNPPYSTLNPNPWLIDGEWYQPQTDCLKAHTNVFGVCVYFLRYKIIIIIIIIIIKIAILCAVAVLL